jgi:hypothetical protein
MNRDQKRCIVCLNLFIPDARVGQRQKVCRNLSCQLERKHCAQKNWLQHNPGYFKGRYLQLKEKILCRQKLKTSLHAGLSPTIQDELTYNNIYQIERRSRLGTIQDELKQIITISKKLQHATASLIYKTS